MQLSLSLFHGGGAVQPYECHSDEEEKKEGALRQAQLARTRNPGMPAVT